MADYEIIYQPQYAKLKSEDTSRVDESTNSTEPIYKTIIPQYMYRPAWGYPRYQPLALLRQLAKNVYASSVFKTIKDIIIDTDWDLVVDEEYKDQITDEVKRERLKYIKFFERPNPEESLGDFLKKVLDDGFKYDSGIINKVFNRIGELLQLRASPGDTFKKNPDEHGYLDSRDEIIFDKGEYSGESFKDLSQEDFNSISFNFYTNYIDRAAYFQFVNSVASQIPIPFGKREICWMTFNPSTDNVYTNGSYLEDSIDIVLSLVYGAKYNLDFYANGNTPEGIINATGAQKKDIKRIKEQLNDSIYTAKDNFGMKRRIGYRMPVTSMDNLDFVKLNLSSKEMEIIDQQKWFTKILWMRFGLNADEMGFTENSNRATSSQQTRNSIRKAIKPIYKVIEECFTYEVLSEFKYGHMFKFKFDFYDVEEQKSIRELQQMEIAMGINSWQNIARKEGINIDELKEDKEETSVDTFNFGDDNKDDDKKEPAEVKSIIKKEGKWCVTDKNKTEVLGCHDNKDDAIDQLQAIEASKDAETKGHPGVDDEDEEWELKAEYEGRKVKLYKPFRISDDEKDYGVYVKTDEGNVSLLKFGSAEMENNRDDEEARKNFRARMKCDTADDKNSARYWACKTWTSKPLDEVLYSRSEVEGEKVEKKAEYKAKDNAPEQLIKQLEKSINSMSEQAKRQIINSLDKENLTQEEVNYIANNTDEYFKEQQVISSVENLLGEVYRKQFNKVEQKTGLQLLKNRNPLDFIQSYTFQNIKGMTQDLGNNLRQELQRGIMNGEGSQQLQKRVQQVFKSNNGRSEAIARTELNRAYSMGELQAWQQSGLKAKKYIDIVNDNRTTEVSKAMSRKYGRRDKAIPIDEVFSVVVNGKEYAGQAPPFMPNDRDSVIFIMED